MRVIDLENINYAMENQTQFVLRCEEVFHDKISAAAEAIVSTREMCPFVALTGPSGSGKTTTAMRLREYLENLGVQVNLLSMDNFFLPADERPPEATDWESPYCVNVKLLLDTICALLGWVPMVVAGIMLVIVTFHPIEKDMAEMRADQAK